MKTYRGLYAKVCDWDNLYWAYRVARKGKRGRPAGAAFEYDLEANLAGLHRELLEKTYEPGRYHSFYIHEPKRRLISAAPYGTNGRIPLMVPLSLVGFVSLLDS